MSGRRVTGSVTLGGHHPTRANRTLRGTHAGGLTRSNGTSGKGLPENTSYRDTGCEYFHSCLACPFPVCRYDPGFGTLAQHSRLAAFATEIADGKSPWEAARVVGLSNRTAYRYRDQLAEGAAA